MDYVQLGKLKVSPALDMIRANVMLAGIAGHNPRVFEWAEKDVAVDFYMCSYYNAAHRDQKAEHVSGMPEWFLEEDRRVMTKLISSLSRPVIHYKVMAAGRNDPKEAFARVAKTMRGGDMVCVGIFQKDKPNMVRVDIDLLQAALDAAEGGPAS